MRSEQRRRRLTSGPLQIDITHEDIVESLLWPGPPPGRWLVPEEPASIERIDSAPESLDRAA